MARLAGKIAIITGAAKGLGEADARLFAKEGATVILTDMDEENGKRVAKEIGAAAEFHKHDVCDEARWIEIIDGVVARHGKLDVLVNNAGIVHPGNIETQTTKEFQQVMAVSSDGTFFGSKYAVLAMKETGGGSIINMASVASMRGESGVIAYCAAKGAVAGMSRGIAVHCVQQGYNIRCNSLHPGTIWTPMVQNIMGTRLPKGVEPKTSPTMGVPNDIANAALYLASDESKHVNGIEMRIDNAHTITPHYDHV